MRNTWLLALAALGLQVPSAASAQQDTPGQCRITFQTSVAMGDVLSGSTVGFPSYAALCARLVNANMGVNIIEAHGLVLDRSYAIIVARLYDRASETMGRSHVSDTLLEPQGERSASGRMLMAALNNALERLAQDAEAQVQSVQSEKSRLRTLFASGGPRPIAALPGTCRVSWSLTDGLAEARRRWGEEAFATDPALCSGLRQESAGIAVLEGSGTGAMRSFGWAAVAPFDRASGVQGQTWRVTITADMELGEAARDAARRDAFGDAIAGLAREPAQFLDALESEVAQARLFYGR